MFLPVWKSAPLLRVVIPVICGIALQDRFAVPGAVYLAATILLILWGFQFLPDRLRMRFTSVQGISWMVVWLSAGACLRAGADIRLQPNWMGHFTEDSTLIWNLQLTEDPVQKGRSVQSTAKLVSVLKNGREIPVSGWVLLKCASDSVAVHLHAGQQLITPVVPKRITSVRNPGAFDYAAYAARKQLFHQIWLKTGQYRIRTETSAGWLTQTHRWVRRRLQETLPDTRVAALAAALLIGYTKELDPELVQAYSDTGVVHIIAISGMHLSLVYLLLNGLFSRIPGISKYRMLRVAAVLILIWSFTCLTGAGASITRAAVMFTCMQLGEWMGRKTQVLNMLTAAALLLLLFDPMLLWDLGFQLSFLALLSLIIFEPAFRKLAWPQQRWLQPVWQLLAAATAAQLLTFPLCLYYFHQFPLVFLLANVLAVPLSTCILYALMLLLLDARWIWIGPATARICTWMIQAMNTWIEWLSRLPAANWKQLPANEYSTLLWYLLIGGTWQWLQFRRKTSLVLLLGALLGFLIWLFMQDAQQRRQHHLIVYQVPGKSLLSVHRGRSYTSWPDTANQNTHLQKTLAAANILYNGTQPDTGLLLQPNGHWPLFTAGNKLIFIPDSLNHVPPKLRRIDILLITRNTELNLEQLAAQTRIGTVVLDASNSLWKIARWKSRCEILHLHCHSVPDQGAFLAGL